MIRFLKKQYRAGRFKAKYVFSYLINYRLSSSFINKYGINTNLFLGGSFDTSGLFFRRDPYIIGRIKTDKKIKTKSSSIDLLIINQTLPFSNALIQLSNASLIGEKLGVKNICLKESFWCLKTGVYINGIQYINGLKDSLPNGVYLQGDFFNLQTLRPVAGHEIPSRYSLLNILKPLFKLPDNHHIRYDLAIHIRSGKLFSAGGSHPYYGQPPLAYYFKILNTFKFSSIVVVYENLENPVISEVVKHARLKCENLSISCGSLQDDLNALFSAKNIVVGVGTFMSGAIALSVNAVNVFTFDHAFNTWGKKVNIINIIDDKGEYKKKVMSGNWYNTPEQNDLMMNYAETNLSIEGFPKLAN